MYLCFMLGEAYALDQFALFFIDVRILKRIPNYVITSMRRFRVGDIRTPWKITKYRVSISNTGSPETSQIYQVSIRWWPASMVNGVARTLKKLRTSNGDYCNKQWFSTTWVWKIIFTTLGELPWVLIFFITHVRWLCNECYVDPLLSSTKKRCQTCKTFWIREWPVRYVRFVT